MNSASRKRKSRQSRTEDKLTQDREVNRAQQQGVRQSRTEDKLTQDREVNRARQQGVRQSRTEDKLAQDCEANTAAQRGKRGSNYADHRIHIETSLRRHQQLPPTSEHLLMHEQRCLSSLFLYYHRCGFENIAAAEEFAQLK